MGYPRQAMDDMGVTIPLRNRPVSINKSAILSLYSTLLSVNLNHE